MFRESRKNDELSALELFFYSQSLSFFAISTQSNGGKNLLTFIMIISINVRRKNNNNNNNNDLGAKKKYIY